MDRQTKKTRGVMSSSERRPFTIRAFTLIVSIAVVILLVSAFRNGIAMDGRLLPVPAFVHDTTTRGMMTEAANATPVGMVSVSSADAAAATAVSVVPAASLDVKAVAAADSVNVLFGLSGNHEGFLAEFEVALKSVLLNAPMDRNLNIYIMADTTAYDSLEDIFNRTELRTWITRNPIHVYTYDVSSHVPAWKEQIKRTIGERHVRSYASHTIGCFFRLFAHHVLPADTKRILYMDTDVVIVANLDGLWRIVEDDGGGDDEKKKDKVFYWGGIMCSGFVVLNVQRLNDIWTMAGQAPLQTISIRDNHLSDQTLFVGVNETFPHEVGVLPPGWDLTISQRWKKIYRPYDIKFPNAGMLHFNGGSSSKESYWKKKSGPMNVHHDTWGTARHYVDYPWTWSRYKAHTYLRPNHVGYPLTITHDGGGHHNYYNRTTTDNKNDGNNNNNNNNKKKKKNKNKNKNKNNNKSKS